MLQELEMTKEMISQMLYPHIFPITKDGDVFKIVREVQDDALSKNVNILNCVEIYFLLLEYRDSLTLKKGKKNA
jgi:hypothetical protein